MGNNVVSFSTNILYARPNIFEIDTYIEMTQIYREYTVQQKATP